MSIPNKRARKVRPTHPGVMLREDFLPEYGLTVSGFSKSLQVSRQTVNELLRERRAVSPEMAVAALSFIRQQPRVLVEMPSARWTCGWLRGTSKGKINHISPLTAA